MVNIQLVEFESGLLKANIRTYGWESEENHEISPSG